MSKIYRNRMILNQRGGSLTIDNTTDQEKVNLSHRSGSNITLANHVTSELASNNKQVLVLNDSFETIGKDSTEFVVKNKTTRVGGSIYELKGFIDQSQLDAYKDWKNTYKEVADLNSQFKILRGGIGFPNGDSTLLQGNRADNPVIGSNIFTLKNFLYGKLPVGLRTFSTDTVATYDGMIRKLEPAGNRAVTKEDVQLAVGGSGAPGLEFGVEKSAATEGGEWDLNDDANRIDDALLGIQQDLNEIEQKMGDGGDEIYFTKRHKFEQVGAEFNDYASIKIDEKGRSQPFEMLVAYNGAFKNHDYVPHVEQVDNSANFPCGNDDAVVGNRYSRTVGSGGINLKTTGVMELGGSKLTVGFKSINLNASHGIQIASENFIEIQSLKTISLRTNRQVYVESALGVRGNVIVGGGMYVEGELYCQHITAPLEVHETQDTQVLGQFSTQSARTLLIGEALVGGNYYPVFAMPTPDLITTYPHSHHHVGVPLRLKASNEDVRTAAAGEGINTHTKIAQSITVINERKTGEIPPNPPSSPTATDISVEPSSN